MKTPKEELKEVQIMINGFVIGMILVSIALFFMGGFTWFCIVWSGLGKAETGLLTITLFLALLLFFFIHRYSGASARKQALLAETDHPVKN
jgi:hypothetical protein